MEIYNFISLAGIVILVLLGWICSVNRKAINWHVVIWGCGLQLLIAWFLFVVPTGYQIFLNINHLVVKIMEASLAGAVFIFGPLAYPPGMTSPSGQTSLGFMLAFQAFPTIIFFSAVVALLYYFNIIPRLIQAFAFVFTRLMKVSGAESLCAASNIFVGVESALTVRPYLKAMTASELCTVLTAGMATVSSNVMAVYVFSLNDVFPNIAGHLVSASLLSAPAALVMSKLLLPETGHPVTLGEDVKPVVEKDGNVFEAIINGSYAGVKLIVGIVALLIAVLGIVALADQLIGWAGVKIGEMLGQPWKWSLKNFFSAVFYPFTFILGVPLKDVPVVAGLIGERLVLTEVIAYQDLAGAIRNGLITEPRSVVIAAYALCGFSHFASMAIFVGGISAVVPEQRLLLSRIALRALVAANLACLMTACVAGLFFTREIILFS